MTPIDFMTCTADDVIVRSALCHPSMLCEVLRQNASTPFNARDVMHDRIAREVAQRCGKQCRDAASLLCVEANPNVAVARMSDGERLAAFSAAAKLQCLSPALAQDIIARDRAEVTA